MSSELTGDRLRELLSYNETTGLFTWRVCRTGNSQIGRIAGTVTTRGYTQISIDGRIYRAARLVMFYMTGEWPTLEIDHINGDRSDNRYSNLREVTRTVNCQNRRRKTSANRSGFLGVAISRKKWRAQIEVGGRTKYIGTFGAPELAHAAYLEAKRRLHDGCTI